MQVVFRAAGLCALSLVGLLGCGGSSFDGHVYRSSEVAFRVGPLPGSWRGIEVDGARLAFRDDVDEATIAVNARCGVVGDDVPLAALTQHLFLNFTEREIQSQTPLELDGRGGLRTELSAKLDGVSKRFVVYVLKKDSCVYDFMWIGAADENQKGLDGFERFVSGFSTKL
jgi:hypothetical protein